MGFREDSKEAYRARIERSLSYIRDNLGGELSLEEAAEAACFSKFHFHRLFAALVGETPADFVRRLRLEKAANLLENRPGLSVTEVAMASGFSSPSVLSRDFSERFGLSPSRWREARRGAGHGGDGYAQTPHPGEGNDPAQPLSDSPRLTDDVTRPPSSEDLLKRFTADEGPLVMRSLPALRLATALWMGPYGPGIAEAWERLYRWAGPRGLLGPQMRTAGISWDNPDITPADRCRYYACLFLPEGAAVSGEIGLLEVPARDYLCLSYRGSEPGLSRAYTELYRRHLPESGLEPEDAPAMELYRGPLGTERIFDLEIAVPVRPMT